MQIVEREALVQVPRREIFRAAMDGMLKSLDPNSQFIADDQYQQLNEDINQEFGGVGLQIRVDSQTDELTAVRAIPATPAAAAGLLRGDVIVEINGKSTRGMSSSAAVTLIRGPIGSTVNLLVKRGQDDPFEVSLTRARIPVDSVAGDTRKDDGEWNFFLESHPHIGYIRLEKFGERSVEEMKRALKQVNDKAALIFDLRSNLGGLLSGSIEIADMFLPPNRLIVSIKGRGETVLERHHTVNEPLFRPEIPLVVLVNRHSASASEIVAACLQDHERAIIIGERSYGKGTVQNLIPLEFGRSYIKLTVASYWRPSNKNIDRTLFYKMRAEDMDNGEWGVSPDPGFECELSAMDSALIRAARMLRDTDPNRTDLISVQQIDNSDGGDDAPGRLDDHELPLLSDEPPHSSNTPDMHPLQENLESYDEEEVIIDSTREVPRWEDIDIPILKAIEYLEKQLTNKNAA